MGISFHITSVREGTIFNVMQFLALEKVTGTLSIKFGRNIPEVVMYFVTGNLTTAEFGSILRDKVIDVLLCQEFAVKEITFAPERIIHINEDALFSGARSLSGIVLNASKVVDECQARSLIYGMMPMKDPKGRQPESLLHVLHDFSSWEKDLSRAPVDPAKDKKAPLKECVLLSRALRHSLIMYQTPLVSLKAIRPLINMLNPMNEKEETNLRGYLRSLLPHPRATHLSIERFYAFASAIESIAQRRGQSVGDQARKAIQELVQQTKEVDPAGV